MQPTSSVRRRDSMVPNATTLSVPRMSEAHVKRHSIHGITEDIDMIKPHQEMGHLSLEEKHYLLAVERGDIVTVNRILTQNNIEQNQGRRPRKPTVNINCVDPLGRSAVLMAIDNENYEMLKLLIDNNVDIKEALLYAVSEEFVEAVELLLDIEEERRKLGDEYVSDPRPCDTPMFTPDITPLILAAHRDNYEIIKILLDRGACLPVPHDSRCDCDECIAQSSEDSLQFSYSRINAYRALSSPCLISLSSKDPILTSFELSWALRRLSKQEHEFKSDYEELRIKCQKFATNLLNHTSSSHDLEVLLNHNVDKTPRPILNETFHLDRLKLAIKLQQKEFVAHPSVQQLLASIWYAGLPGFRRKNVFLQTLDILKIGLSFPILSFIYILSPSSAMGKKIKTPFVKFICHSASYITFLVLVVLRGLWPTDRTSEISIKNDWSPISVILSLYVFALMWNEMKSLWRDGFEEYSTDLWNITDFISTSLYLCDLSIRLFFVLSPKGRGAYLEDRKFFTSWVHPKLTSEALFSTANILSTCKIVYIFSVNPHLGPLQIVLARVIMDIAKFFFLYVLVLFAFSTGLNYLLKPYAKLHEELCQTNSSDFCTERTYSKFINLFETTQTLFWTAFGELDLKNFNLNYIQESTKFWGMLMYGFFCVISIVVLLNLLIAMMDHSYNKIFEDADVEWKFARSKLWISYFGEGGTVPPPFNIIPTPKSVGYFLSWFYGILCPRSKSSRPHIIEIIMKNLVQRYVIARQKRDSEHNTVTVDDINELKQEVSSFRIELLQILRESGMKTKTLDDNSYGVAGKKNRLKERRLIKGLNIEFSESVSDSLECAEAELERCLFGDDRRCEQKNPFSEILQPIFQGAPSIFKKKKIKKIFSRVASTSKSSWESGEDAESDSKTPDSDVTDGNGEKRVWFSDDIESQNSGGVVETYIDETQPESPRKEFSFLTDSLNELDEENKEN